MTNLVRSWSKHLIPPVPGWQSLNPLDRGLVGEWRFDRNTGLLLPDYSGYGQHGTIVGADWVTTRYGPALDFNSGDSDYVYVNNDYSGLPCTVEILCEPDDTSAIRVGLHLNEDGAIGSDLYIAFWTDNSFRGFTRDNVGTVQTSQTGAFPLGPAYHVIYTVKTGEQIVYVNGKIEAGPNNQVFGAITLTQLAIGEFRDAALDWDGRIALTRIYNRILTANEAQARYQLVLKRMQTFGGEWRIAGGVAPAVDISIPVAMRHYRNLRT